VATLGERGERVRGLVEADHLAGRRTSAWPTRGASRVHHFRHRIVRALARPGHRDEDTWINILHARDGAWGVGGRVLTSDDLVAGIMAAAGASA
jgi:hypothetical protein